MLVAILFGIAVIAFFLHRIEGHAHQLVDGLLDVDPGDHWPDEDPDDDDPDDAPSDGLEMNLDTAAERTLHYARAMGSAANS